MCGVCVFVYMCVFIFREREREIGDRPWCDGKCLPLKVTSWFESRN